MILLDKSYALSRWIYQGATNCFEHFRSFKQPIKVSIVNRGFWIKEYSQLLCLRVRLLDYILVIALFDSLDSLLYTFFDLFNYFLRNWSGLHHTIRAIGDISLLNANLMIEFVHIVPPFIFLIYFELFPQKVFSELLVDELHSFDSGYSRVVWFYGVSAKFWEQKGTINTVICAANPFITGIFDSEPKSSDIYLTLKSTLSLIT